MSTSSSSSKEEKKVDVAGVSGFPPMHALAIWGAMVACFVSTLPSFETMDQVAKPETFTHVVFPEYMSTQTVGYIRLTIAGLMLALTVHDMLLDTVVQTTQYLPNSKLIKTPMTLKGWKLMCFFTNWSWALLNLSFFLNGYLALYPLSHGDYNIWIMRMATIAFDSSAPSTMLVSAVIKYVIWDQILKESGNTNNLQTPSCLIHHNLNCILAISEVALLGGIPVRMQELSAAPLYGLAFIVFSWAIRHNLADDKTRGPQYLYFFLDTTLGYTTSISMLCLLIVFIIFYAFFCLVNLILQEWWFLGNTLWSHIVFVALFSFALCRFRD